MANIKNELNNIKSALYGKDVRGSIHDGIDAINKEVENTTGRQVDLENTFDQLVINAGNSNAEIVEARVKNDGTSYSKLGDRLDAVDSQLAQNMTKVNEQFNTIIQEFKNENILSKNNQIIAHRGCWTFVPENALESIIDAKKYGYDFVELDISKTSDNQYILMHDTTVDRTTNGTGSVSSLTLSYIKSLFIDVGIYTEGHVYKVPTFEEAVSICSQLGLGINLDCSKIWFNEATINEVVLILQKYGMFEKTFFVISDNARELITTLYPDVYVTWLNNNSDLSTAIADVKKYKNSFIAYKISEITQAMVYEFNRYNVKFCIYGVTTDYELEKAMSYNPTFIEVDNILPKKEAI